jgi:RHS repeat-associated protein
MNGLHHHAPKGGGLLLRVEEDRTWDAEMLHGTEVVDCVAIEGDGVLTAEAAESETKYYYLDSLRVAMREGDVVFLIVSDHLGTTSLVLDEDEVYHSETRHYAYGTERWADGTVPTDYRFTGQKLTPSINLYHMGARWYDDRLGTWVSADVIVPEPGSSRALNRFAFVYWNPLTLVDLSGFGPRVPMIEGV